MKLWTVQSLPAYEILLQQGELVCPRECATQEFLESYDWMISQMVSRLSITPNPEQVPLWGWTLYEGKCELTLEDVQYYALPIGTEGMLLEIEVADEEVLLSDFQAWHSVLNNCFLSLSEAEDEEFDARLEAAKCSQGFSVQYLPEPFRSEILKSWERIFELYSRPGWLHGAKGLQDIQATFWRIELCQVRSASRFVGLVEPETETQTETEL